MLSKIVATALFGTVLAGCVATDSVRFRAGVNQTELIRDGRPAISSVSKQSIALLGRTGREVPQGQRVGFVLAMQNRTNIPLNFHVSSISVEQVFDDRPSEKIEVLTFEQLQREERTRQFVAAVLVGAAAGANAAAASRAGYYRSNSTVYTPRGTYGITTVGYSPAAAAIAQANAANQNAANINATIQNGQQNMARLESEYIKDHTLLPQEWYGGVVGIAPPVSEAEGKAKRYQISIVIGGETHRFEAVQELIKR